jgi:two-component system sensor histidine kinase KdpD
MEFRARLVHADAQRRVVLVKAFAGERCLGSALGEAANAEDPFGACFTIRIPEALIIRHLDNEDMP